MLRKQDRVDTRDMNMGGKLWGSEMLLSGVGDRQEVEGTHINFAENATMKPNIVYGN